MKTLSSKQLIVCCISILVFFPACQKFGTIVHHHKVLFISNATGTNKIYSMNNDGTNVVQLTFGNIPDGRATWSPDGRFIAFASGPANNRDIYIMDAQGQGLKNITNTPGADEDWPEWSPIDYKVIFSSNRDGNHEIYEYNFEHGSQHRLTNRSQDDKWPTYSPDGRKIAFQSVMGAGNTEVFKMDKDGGNVIQLTSDPAADQMPAWSPDGTRIIFMSTRTISDKSGPRNWPRIFFMNSNGTNQLELITERSARPSWSRHENAIVFTHSSTFPANPETWEIYKVKGDGTGMTRLTNNSVTDDFPYIK